MAGSTTVGGTLLRSLLFVPGDDERKIQKALGCACGMVVVDLEDAVADPAKAAALDVELVGTLEEALRRADYVSLHGRLDDRTRGMIGEKELALLKPTANFVNVARGEMVDEHALIRLLREHRIAGAALEVFQTEPLPPDSPFWDLPNVFITPHIGGYVVEYEDFVMPLVVDNMRLFLAGRQSEMQNIVAR